MNDENILRRIPPNNQDAEQSVIGAMIMDRAAIKTAAEILIEDDFYYRQLGIMFSTIVELEKEENAVDPVTLQNRLREKNVSLEVCSDEFIVRLVERVPTSANVKYYANIVKNKSTLRKLIKACNDAENACYTEADDVEGVLSDAEKNVLAVTQKRSAGIITPIDQIVMNSLNIMEQASKMKGHITGIATGFTDLDYSTSGFHSADLVLIAARPSMGKTAFALNIAEYMALHDNKCVAIFSLEMPKEQLVNRLIAMDSRVDSTRIKSGDLTDSDWNSVIDSAGIIAKSKFIIDDSSGITIQDIQAKCRKFKSEAGLDIVFIDYLQLVGSKQGKNSSASRQEIVAEISKALKSLARELEIPIIALSQLNREAEKRADHLPILSDLRESGSIEQDADMVMFIHREDFYNKDTEKKGVAQIIIAKQRNGPIGTVELAWLPEYTKFANLATDRK
ncbi:replicative DNA helicase DnaB2 (plasmid) [Butyrivibrio proteoclasticus B316]|uniref:Replicative DNA helicase n=1 Tax=Butyrivibrio proteoclasticus (strain ATCC 51982 / DSM 14932 / B316) TaxID=515622 RepID=E0S504_BUTPB|nr:replicative DNA helicase [Butyrivibrio proteoclasticus]ADL36486.1 replicative DNA helicase DnaB2 [Butyrivibrio proteoclasticus B316]